MTLPDERYRAILWAKRFLEEVAYDKKKYPRVPKAIRTEAYNILRHYPNEYDMMRASQKAPDVFQERMEPLYRMIKQHEQDKENGT